MNAIVYYCMLLYDIVSTARLELDSNRYQAVWHFIIKISEKQNILPSKSSLPGLSSSRCCSPAEHSDSHAASGQKGTHFCAPILSTSQFCLR